MLTAYHFQETIMLRSILSTVSATALLALAAGSAQVMAADNDVDTAPPAELYQAVSDLVELPDFIPGLGQLFVDPDTLPAGPFLGYDHDGKLVNTTYMIPLSAMDADLDLSELAVPDAEVTHTDINYNAGHPGVEEPHIHIVLWHIPADETDRVAE